MNWRLVVHLAGSLTIAAAMSAIPAVRAEETTVPRDVDPGAVFDALWNRFNEQYALFGDKRIPWDAVRRAYRDRAVSAATEAEFFNTLAEMLALLNDNHVKLIGWGDVMSQAGSLRRVGSLADFSAEVVRQKYLVGSVRERANGNIVFGWLPNSVGYIHVRAMNDLSTSSSAMREALAMFARSRALVLDLRQSLGGDDPVAQTLAGLLADRPRRYMTSQLKSGPGPADFTAARHWNISPPSDGAYGRPVAVLTHRATFSASENFVLALRTLPHVVVVGTETAGSMGETTNDVLPNGWVYRTVIGRIVDVDGRSWEGVGIPPDVRIVNDPGEISAGRDRALEAAVGLVTAANDGFPRRHQDSIDRSLDIRLPLADSLSDWLDAYGLEVAMDRFHSARRDSAHWHTAEDWEYGDLTTLGRRLLRESRMEEGVAVLEAAVVAYPTSYRPHVWLYQAYSRSGQEEAARRARERALELNPRLYAEDRRVALELSGRIPLSHEFLERLFRKGAEEAIRHYRQIMTAERSDAHVDPLLLVRGGQQLREAGQLQHARTVFLFIAAEFPKCTLGYLGVAEVSRSLGDEEQALRSYEEVLRIEPGHRRAREAIEEISRARRGGPLIGGWIGKARNGSLVAKIRLCIRADESAGLSTIDVPEFGYYDVSARVERSGDGAPTISFSLRGMSARLALIVDGDEASGRWEGAGAPGEVRLRRSEGCGPRYRAEPIVVDHSDVRLSGTLLLPRNSPGPYPAVVWTHGSGSVDRTNPTYRGLAVALTELGVASLIYDKRGVGESAGPAAGVTMRDLAADAIAVVEALREHPEVISDVIGVGGISQGGWISPAAAAASASVRFVVGLSAPGVTPAEQNLFNQHNRILKAGFSKQIAEQADTILRAIYRHYRTGEGRAAVEAMLESVANEAWFEAAHELAFWRRRGLKPLSEAYLDDLFFDPVEIWSKVTVPAILVWGETDELVPARFSKDVIQSALVSAGNADRSLLIFPRTDHALRLPPVAPWTWGLMHPGYRAVADFILAATMHQANDE